MPAVTSRSCRPLLHGHFHVTFADQLWKPGIRTVSRNPYMGYIWLAGRAFDAPGLADLCEIPRNVVLSWRELQGVSKKCTHS